MPTPAHNIIPLTEHPGFDTAFSGAPYVVIGAGPVGIRMCQELARRDRSRGILLFGDERQAPYDRIRLSNLLAGNVSQGDIELGNELDKIAEQLCFENTRIHTIDRENHRVTDATGRSYTYHRLIIATGSQPNRPQIRGMDLRHVYTFRDLKDAAWLSARQARSRHTVVLGGGLLGLETAKAMRRSNTRVTVIQQAPRLLNRQLDATGSEKIRQELHALGIEVIVSNRVQAILGTDKPERGFVCGVELRDGTRIDCDTVIVAAGIKPNIQLAQQAKLAVGQGIKVNDQLQTSDPHIYAVGECIEHRGQCYGLVAPGFEQAGIAASVLAGNSDNYSGSLSTSQLKVIETPVFSSGDADVEDDSRDTRSLRWQDDTGQYRKLVLRRNRLVGALAVGHWKSVTVCREALENQRYLSPWARMRFTRRGELKQRAGQEISRWPDTALICNCKAINCGQLRSQIDAGAACVSDLRETTGASSVCGSCEPLLDALLTGSPASPKAVKDPWLLTGSLAAAIVALLYVSLQSMPDISSMQQSFRDLWLWRDGLWKQITGFTILGLALASLLMSIAKRNDAIPGKFVNWRRFHTLIGVVCLSLLFLHSGNHWGSELNRLLMTNFVALAALGALVGFATLLESRFELQLGKRIRQSSGWLHLMVFFPLPALLGIHILSVYYF